MNILSIDIDYAYSPTISSYDDYVVGSKISLEEQEKLIKQKGLPSPKVNNSKLEILREVLDKKTGPKVPLNISSHHHSILHFLPTDTSFSIYNFDHHHDIYYPGWHSLEELDEGNWVFHTEHELIDKYVWFCNEDSEQIEDISVVSFPVEIVTEVVLPSLPNFDMVFCCYSPHWTGDSGRKNLVKILRSDNEL